MLFSQPHTHTHTHTLTHKKCHTFADFGENVLYIQYHMLHHITCHVSSTMES